MPFRDIQEDEFTKTKIVNVLNYGAKGDGSTDDLSAFNDAITAAYAAGSKVFVPAGTYILSAALEIPGNGFFIAGYVFCVFFI